MGIDKKFKAGIVGCGAIFPMHAQSVKIIDNAEITAVCDIREDKARAAAEAYNCAYYTDYKDMIDNSGIDTVHICAPHYLHAPVAVYSANAKKSILTEKPMSINYSDAVEMVRAAKDNNVTLGVIFQNHYNPGSVFIKKILQSGELGRVLSGKAIVTWSRSDEYYSLSDWKGTWDKEGGGALINQSIHTIDLLRWFVDSGIDYVDASLSNRAHKKIEVEDCAEGIIKFKNGVMAGFYCINYYSYDAPVEIELCCENGKAKIIGDKSIVTFNDGREIIGDKNLNEMFTSFNGAKSYWGVSHIKQIQDFYNALSKNEQPFINGDYALKTQELICAIYKSGKTKEKVFL